jgi:hypothetical protein
MPGATNTIVIKSNLPGGSVGATALQNASILDSTADGLVARAGGGQGSATPLTGKLNRIITVATGADSALLPAAVAGLVLKVKNDGANSANIFPQNNGDIINALAVNTAFAQAATLTVTYTCYTTGKWVTN